VGVIITKRMSGKELKFRFSHRNSFNL